MVPNLNQKKYYHALIMASLLCAFLLSVVFVSVCSGAPSTINERCFSYARNVSARRLPGESYKQALKRHKVPTDCIQSYDRPVDLQKPMHELDIEEIPEVSLEALEREYSFIRDTRFINDYNDFPRRCSWMYPDDGCHARAELAAHKLIGHDFVAPKKIFAFGDLAPLTDNHPDGTVTWWYHVVVGYRVGETIYVIDPSLNPYKILTLLEWTHAMGGDETNVKFSVCHQFTFTPFNYCYTPDNVHTEPEAEERQRFWLEAEWDRLVEMDRNPKEELGDNPPWL